MLTIYSRPNCQACDMAKQFLKSKNVDFKVTDIMADPSAKEFLLKEGHRAVPQLYFNGKLFVEGGYVGLSKMSDADLQSKLQSTEPA